MNQRRELFGIQYLRAMAAIAVLVHHALVEAYDAPGQFSPDWLTTSGASGVDIFFVISGFIMVYTSFPAGRAISAPVFLLRRATRIYPFYWLCCLAILTMVGLGFLSGKPLTPTIVVSSLLLLPSDSKLLGVSWTLVYEMYFYLVFSATLFFSSRQMSVALTALTMGAIFMLSTMLPGGAYQAFLSSPIIFEFCMGMVLGHLFLSTENFRVPLWIGVAALILLFAAPAVVPPANTAGLDGLTRVLWWGLPSVVLLAASLSLDRPKHALGRFGLLLGDASYALYLTHAFVLIGYGVWNKTGALGGMSQIVIVPLIVAFSIGIGILAHLYVEKPVLKAVRKITKPVTHALSSRA